MSETTDPTNRVVIPIEPAETDTTPQALGSLIKALAAAETAAGTLRGSVPHTLTVIEYRGTYSVSLFFSADPEQVLEFATAHDVPMSRIPVAGGSVDSEAEALIRGIAVKAWTRTADPEATTELDMHDAQVPA